MWDQKHWKWKYPYWIADLVLVLAYLAVHFLFPAWDLRWKLLAALAAAALCAAVIFVYRKKHPEPEEEQKNGEDPYPPF